MRGSPLLLTIVLLLHGGCGGNARAGAPRRTLPKVRPSWPRIRLVDLGTVEVARFDPLAGLDSLFRLTYADSRRLPATPLRVLRTRASYLRGHRLRRTLFVLAVRLWRKAAQEEAALGLRPYDPERRRIWERRWHAVEAMRQESLFILRYLASLPSPSPAVLEHLAFYTAETNPQEAISLLRRLMADRRVSMPGVYAAYLVSLYVRVRHLDEAVEVASKHSQHVAPSMRLLVRGAALLWEGVFHDPSMTFGAWLSKVGHDILSVEGGVPLAVRAFVLLGHAGGEAPEAVAQKAREYALSIGLGQKVRCGSLDARALARLSPLVASCPDGVELKMRCVPGTVEPLHPCLRRLAQLLEHDGGRMRVTFRLRFR